MIDARTAPYAALLLRVSLGVLLLAHGLLLKVLTFGVPGTVGYFQSIGYPGFFAYLVMLGEIG
ncbi:MAG: DoxX family membrane protein, partial [Rhodoplanes sp.]